MTTTTLIVGENSYLTLEQSNAYINTHFPSDHPQIITWQALTTEEQESHLLNATQAIESIRWAGQIMDPTQMLAFPRQRAGFYQPDYFTKTFSQTVEKRNSSCAS